MEAFKLKLPERETHYLSNTEEDTPLIDLMVFENSITIREHGESGYAAKLTFDPENSTPESLSFTTRSQGILSYFLYQIDVKVDLTGGGIPDSPPLFALWAGIPVLRMIMFEDIYILRVLKKSYSTIL